ncbi:MAG: hypothetical protein K8S20_12595 [Chloroflexi bacterium]|nr:hypothetical protein [Chloroflexota bacterium]
MHWTLGILATSQAVFYASAFFRSDGFVPSAPAPVTQTVGQFLLCKVLLEDKENQMSIEFEWFGIVKSEMISKDEKILRKEL